VAGPKEAKRSDFRYFNREFEEDITDLLHEAAARAGSTDRDTTRLTVMDLAHLVATGPADDPTTIAARQRLDRYADGTPYHETSGRRAPDRCGSTHVGVRVP
jgi:hypothetical protein